MGVTLFGAPDTLAVVRRGCLSYCWCNGVVTTRVGVTPVGVPDTCTARLGVCVGVTLFGAPDIPTIMRVMGGEEGWGDAILDRYTATSKARIRGRVMGGEEGWGDAILDRYTATCKARFRGST